MKHIQSTAVQLLSRSESTFSGWCTFLGSCIPFTNAEFSPLGCPTVYSSTVQYSTAEVKKTYGWIY
eukprot:COSAG02_NODE_37477_length_441_cov_1.078947_2_plen_65_part_01